MAENNNGFNAGIITLDQQENNPYLPWVNLSINAINGFIETLRNHPDAKPDDLQPHLTAIIKLDTNKTRSKKVEMAYTEFNAERALEQKLIDAGVSKADYDNNLEKKRVVDAVKLNDTQKEKAKRMALIDQFGLFISEYMGPKFDVDGHKMCIMIGTLRNDKDILINTGKLNQEEREKLNITQIERLMTDEF